MGYFDYRNAPVYRDFWLSDIVDVKSGVNMLRIYSDYAPLDSLGFLGGFYRGLVLNALDETFEKSL